MKSKKLYMAIIVMSLTILTMTAMEPNEPINFSPDIVVNVINKTNRAYKIIPIHLAPHDKIIMVEEKAFIIKAGREKRTDLTQNWHYPNDEYASKHRTNGLTVIDNNGNRLLNAIISLSPYYSPGLLDVQLADGNNEFFINGDETTFRSSKKVRFLINLHLEGDDLRKSRTEIVVIER